MRIKEKRILKRDKRNWKEGEKLFWKSKEKNKKNESAKKEKSKRKERKLGTVFLNYPEQSI